MSPSSSRAGGQRLRRLLALTAVASTAAAGSAVLAPAASAAEQPWGFEQVTPPVKGEGTVGSADGFRASQDGNAILYTAKTPFSSVSVESSPLMVRYLGMRGDTSWSSRGIDPPMGVPGYNHAFGAIATSENLRYVLVGSTAALTPGAIAGGGSLYIRDTRTGAYTLVATSTERALADEATQPFAQTGFPYVANDGRSALFGTRVALDPDLPGGIFVWRAGTGLELASVLPDGTKVTAITVGTQETGVRDPMPRDLNALDHVYFSFYGSPAYVRTGTRTRVVSVSRIPGDPDTPAAATPIAVGAGGKTVVFETPTPLTTDTDPSVFAGEPAGAYIYLYRYDDDSLTYIGPGGPQDPVLHMVPDASTIAFASTVALTPGAEAGKRNFYVWRNGAIHYVATADVGSTASTNAGMLRLLSPNGRYFAYNDNAPSAARRFGIEDNESINCRPGYSLRPGPCDQVYVFDVETDRLECASCDPGGAAPTGHAGDPWGPGVSNIGFARGDQRQPQTVTNDGTTFFTSGGDLVPEDANYLPDVYSYAHGGGLRLLSRGRANARSRFLDATRDGSAVFFSTDDAIVPTDIDRSVDIYMTRAGAGYDYGPVQPEPAECAGGDCREPFADQRWDTVAGTVTFAAAEDLPDGEEPVPPAGRVSVSQPRTVRGARGVLRVSVRAPGRIAVSGGRRLQRSAVRARGAGSYRVAVRLSRSGRLTLQRRGRVQVRVSVEFSPRRGAVQTARVPVTFVAVAARKGR